MSVCRNCGQDTITDLGSIGALAPFFLKRVLGIDLGWQQSPRGLKRRVRNLAGEGHTLLSKIAAPCAYVAMQFCDACSFVQTTLPFAEEAIGRLYADYRSDSYNAERLYYEPSYADIAPYVGKSPVEINARVSAETSFLEGKINVSDDFTVLDFGGADGKYIPPLRAKKFVYEISDIRPIEGVTRIFSEDELTTYSFVQATHVIEHVVYPLKLIRSLVTRVAPGGYLYLETPQDLPNERLHELKSGKSKQTLLIHEHINQYNVAAVTKLIESAGLHVVAVESSPVDMGYSTPMHVRGLGQKL